MSVAARRAPTPARGGRGVAISAGASGRTTRPGRSSSTSGGPIRDVPADPDSESAPIPRGTPDRDMGTRPVPSTGPYMIESYVPERALTLVRNPYFRVWSRAARPDGFPDEIEFRLGRPSGRRHGRRARAGRRRHRLYRATEDVKALEDFEARYASQVHVHAEQATVFLFLNTTTSSLRRRPRAARGQLRRRPCRHLRSYGGPELAQPTCQLRPPGTVGFRRYCPYTAAPGRTGEWKAPDLTRARRLVAASGTRGMRVTVWTYPGFWEPAAAEAVRALEELGYRASIRRARDLDAYIAKSDRREDAGRAGRNGRLVRRPPDGLVPPRLVQVQPTRISASSATGGSTPGSRGRSRSRPPTRTPRSALWARIERDIVDLAPWVPLFTPSRAPSSPSASATTSTTPSGDPARSALVSADGDSQKAKALRRLLAEELRVSGRRDIPTYRVVIPAVCAMFEKVELAGLEPATSWVRSRRSPN